MNDIADPHAEFARLAATLGADIPVCIGGGGRKAAFMWGIGDEVWRPGGARLLPAGGLAAVLVNETGCTSNDLRHFTAEYATPERIFAGLIRCLARDPARVEAAMSFDEAFEFEKFLYE